jgi:hypothetical protein
MYRQQAHKEATQSSRGSTCFTAGRVANTSLPRGAHILLGGPRVAQRVIAAPQGWDQHYFS